MEIIDILKANTKKIELKLFALIEMEQKEKDVDVKKFLNELIDDMQIKYSQVNIISCS